MPDLFFIECANLFWKWVQRHAYPAKAAAGHMYDVTRLNLTSLPTEALTEKALALALRHRITAYGACYAAAALELGIPLITADRKLAAALAKAPFEIHWLGALPAEVLSSA